MGLTIYIASAGSGKTFQLVRQYLEKVIKNTNDYQRILAITFTNKAAEEMKSRIISELLILSNGQKSDHRQHLIDTLKIADDLVQQRAEIVMQKILHDYSSFGVSTIDSYFQVLSKTLSRELKLPIHYTIELDIDNIADTITDRVLELSGKNKQLTEWLEELLIDNIDNNKGWNIKSDLKGMVKEIINRPIVNAFSNALSANDYQVYVRNLKNSKKPHAEAILNKLIEIKSLVESNGYTEGDFKGKSRGTIATLFKLIDDPSKIISLDFEKSIKKAIDNYDELIPTKAKQEFIDFIASTLHPALLDFEKVYFANIIELLTINEILKLSYQAGVIEKLNESLKLYRDEYQTFLLSDTTKLLQDFSRDDDASFIYEKSGNTYNYLFIDEFQDTSDAQWKILKPMVMNSLSLGKDSLIVGDAKQSIYRWRGGNMELILKGVREDLKQFSQSITETPLNTNYRSKNNLIYFNNELFKSTSNEIKTKLKETNVTLDKAYDDANMRQTDQGEKTKGGYIEINFIDAKAIKEAEANENVLEVENEIVEEAVSASEESDAIPLGNLPKMVAIIEDALKRNYTLGDIAILVRKNDDEVKIADFLLHETTIDFISSNSLKITANNKVRFIISCLRFLYDTQNQIIEEELNYFAEKLQIADSTVERNANFLNKYQQTWVKLKFKNEIDKLKTLPVNICYWEILKLTGLDYFDLYLEKFHDVMMEYTSKEGGSIEYFLKWWDEKSKTKDWTVSLPTVNNAVRIITIHQSKGLEFPIVIMPFADWEITPKSNQTIWGETTASPYDSTAASPLIFTKKLEHTHFSKSYFKEIDNSYVDNLNLLYVAFTRAKSELYVFSNLKSNEKRLGNLLLSSIRSNAELSPKLIDTDAVVQLIIGSKENNTAEEKKKNDSVQLKINSVSNQSLINTTSVLPTLSYKIKNADQLYGDYLHHLLSKLSKADELDKVLFTTKIKFNINDNNIIERLNKDALLALKLLDENNFNDGSYTIKNESSIYFEGETLRPDRVLMKDQTAIIIDFKSGGQDEKHNKQVEKYCSVIEKMGFQEVKGYLLYTETNSLVPIN
jgi:ATP-dependent exoDNAse (exonuclease V) beta subunit